MKLKQSEDKFVLGNQLRNNCVETDSSFKIQNAKFNVIHSSEISKVLRELTQCIANDHDLFSNSNMSLENAESQTSKDNESNSMKKEKTSHKDSIKSEMSSSTVASTDASVNQAPKSESDKHICLQCGKQFNKRDFLQKHKIVHEIPRHKCMACEKSFVREDKLKRHFTSIHSKHRPHICDVCSKAFARKDKLKDHQKHHITAGNSFQCAECRVPFVQKSDLNRHFRGVHKGEAGVGINIPSKRFAKSKVKDEAPKTTAPGSGDQLNQAIPADSTPSSSSEPMMITSTFYPIQTPMLPLSASNSHLTQISTIADLSKSLIKPSISFIPALPLKVELNYTAHATTLPHSHSHSQSQSQSQSLSQSISQSLSQSQPQSQPQLQSDNQSNNLFEKENFQVRFKSKRSHTKPKSKSKSKSKSKQNHHKAIADESSTLTKLTNANHMTPGNCKPDTVASSFNCLVSSPMISVFPSSADFYSTTHTSSSKTTTAASAAAGSSSLVTSSSATMHGYHQPSPIDRHLLTSLSSSNSQNASIKPTYSLGTNNITFAHQNLYQLQQNQLRYYSYLQPGSHFFGQHSTRPLTANVYPYMPF